MAEEAMTEKPQATDDELAAKAADDAIEVAKKRGRL